jgi:hypothetical protein
LRNKHAKRELVSDSIDEIALDAMLWASCALLIFANGEGELKKSSFYY